MASYNAPFKGYYLTAYGLAVKKGFQGSEEDWLNSLKGAQVEIRYEKNRLSWRRAGEPWQELTGFTAQQEAWDNQMLDSALAAQAAREAGEKAQTTAAKAGEEAKTIALQAVKEVEEAIVLAEESAREAGRIGAVAASQGTVAAAQGEQAASQGEQAQAAGLQAQAQADRAQAILGQIESTDLGGLAANVVDLQQGKVDKEPGKGLSSLDYTQGDKNRVEGAAPLFSPVFTGTPTAPTAPAGDSSGKLATTAYVRAQGYVTQGELGQIAGQVPVGKTGSVPPHAWTRGEEDAQGQFWYQSVVVTPGVTPGDVVHVYPANQETGAFFAREMPTYVEVRAGQVVLFAATIPQISLSLTYYVCAKEEA